MNLVVVLATRISQVSAISNPAVMQSWWHQWWVSYTTLFVQLGPYLHFLHPPWQLLLLLSDPAIINHIAVKILHLLLKYLPIHSMVQPGPPQNPDKFMLYWAYQNQSIQVYCNQINFKNKNHTHFMSRCKTLKNSAMKTVSWGNEPMSRTSTSLCNSYMRT